MKHAVFLCATAWVLAGCNSGGETPGLGGGNQGSVSKTGINFVEPLAPSYGFHIGRFDNDTYMSIDLDDKTKLSPIGISVSGADLGDVFVESGSSGVFSVSGPADLSSGSNTVNLRAEGSTRNINAKLVVKNFDPAVTSRENAKMIREAGIYAFPRKSVETVVITPVKFLNAPNLPALPGSMDLRLDLNAIYNQAVTSFSNIIVNRQIGHDWRDNGDKVLDIINEATDLGPEVQSLFQAVSRRETEITGVFLQDINLDLGFKDKLRVNASILTMNVNIAGLLRAGDRIIIGPYDPTTAPNKCTEIFTVQTVSDETLFLREVAGCEHPGGTDISTSHFVKAQNTVLGLAYAGFKTFFVRNEDIDNIEITIAHELGHLNQLGALDHAEDTDTENLMHAFENGIHLDNNQWNRINP